MLVILSMILLYNCSKDSNSKLYKVEKTTHCSTTTLSSGILFKCPDGSSSFLAFPSNGTNGSSCTVQQVATGAHISCSDGSFASIYNGTDGSNCSTTSTASGAVISCSDGTNVSINHGNDGGSCTIADLLNGAIVTCGNEQVVIFDGENALVGAIAIANYIRPCGNEFPGDEIFLRLTDGNILALFDGGPNEDRLTLLYPGNWITTDRNRNNTCHFTIDNGLNVINEVVH